MALADAASGGGNGWIGILGGSGGMAVLALLYWVLRRTDRALERSNSAIKQTNENMAYTGANMRLVMALRQAIFLQGNNLDQWEEWGGDVRAQHRRMQQQLVDHGVLDHIEDLPTPPTHLDLGNVFRGLPEFGQGSADGMPSPNETPTQQDVSMINRLFGRT